jgi:hybrid cluster-associated redox disulfide protein
MRKQKIKEEKINPKMSFAEVLEKYPEASEIFYKYGMHCFGCPAAMMENLEAGIKAHGLNVKKVIDELNKAIKNNRTK